MTHVEPPRAVAPADTRARPAPRTDRRWLLDLLLGLGVGWLLLVAASVTIGDMSMMGDRPGQGRMGRGRLWDRVALGPWLRASSLVVGAAVAAARLFPHTAWLVGLAGAAVYLADGGAPVAAVIAAIALGRGLLTPVVGAGVSGSGASGAGVSGAGVSGAGASRRWPWLLALVPAYAAAGFSDRADAGTFFSVPTMIVWTVLPLVAVAALHARGRQRRLERTRQLEQVARSERLRLARDIHDVVGHSLSLISLQSGVALKVLDTDPAQARRSLEAIRATSKQALAEVRTTLGVFREERAFRDGGVAREDEGAPLAPTPGLVAIRQMVEQAASSGVNVTLTSDVDPAWVPASTQSVAHRVVQEGLTNAIRHAPGAPIAVTLGLESGWLRVRVADRGPEVATIRPGNGLTGMRERVEAISGHLSLGSGPDGFVVEALLPVADVAEFGGQA